MKPDRSSSYRWWPALPRGHRLITTVAGNSAGVTSRTSRWITKATFTHPTRRKNVVYKVDRLGGPRSSRGRGSPAIPATAPWQMRLLAENTGCVAIGSDGSVYISDYGNNRIRKIAPNGIINHICRHRSGRFSWAMADRQRRRAFTILPRLSWTRQGTSCCRYIQLPHPQDHTGGSDLNSGRNRAVSCASGDNGRQIRADSCPDGWRWAGRQRVFHGRWRSSVFRLFADSKRLHPTE
jgi:hypothetical protein